MPETTRSPVLIDRPAFTLKIYPERGFAEYISKEDVILDEDVARESKHLLEKHHPGRKYFLLVSSEGFFRVTSKARILSADPGFSNHLAAVACYTNHAGLSLVAELYNKINKPAVPTRIFSCRDAAKEWLETQMKQETP